MLEVAGISVFYGSIQALWDVTFEVREGEIVTLLWGLMERARARP